MKRILIISFTLLLLFLELGFKWKDTLIIHQEFKTKNVVVLVIDGPRYSETFGDTSYKYIPRMGKEMVKEGTLYINFMNNGPTHTTSGHTAITTGVYQSISNGGKELPKNPSFFQYFLKSTKSDKNDAWLISSKGKLEVLANTKNKKWWNTYMPSSYCGSNGNGADYVGDAETWKKIQKVFTEGAPKLTLINLLGVDAHAHQNDWEGYIRSLKECDEYAYQLWKLIQNNPKLKNQTTLFITNDHGRHLDGHKDGFVSHGDKCMGCKHISLLALGPDVKKNVIISTSGELVDINKTISTVLDFEIPKTKGRFLKELFTEENL